MKDVTLKLQTGHGPGQTSIAYANTPKEVSLVTSGADGRVYLRDALILEPQHSCKVDTPPATILAVDPKGKFVAVGDDSYVKLHKLPSLSLERVACRFNLTLRALAFSPDGSRLAAAGDDMLIKVVEVKDGSVYRNLNCDDYVLSLAWDPDGTFLAATLRSGGLVVYDTSTGKLEKRVEGLCEKVDYTAPRRHSPSWHPSGGLVLAVPCGAEGDVALHERLSWEATGYLSGEHSKAVNVVAFSPNGVYAATAGQDKRIVVWDVNSVTAVAAAVAEEVMSGLVWRPDGNELAMVGESGGVGVWSGVVPSSMSGPAVPAEELERLQREEERRADLKRRGAKDGEAGEDLDLVPPEGGEIREEIIEEVEMDGEGDADLGAAGAGRAVAAAATTSSAGGGGDGGGGDAAGEDAVSGGSGGGGGRPAAAGGRHGGGVNGRPAVRTQTTVRTIVRTVVAPPSGPAPQPAFQPGSTPAPSSSSASSASSARFLCYSLLGSVTSRPVDDHHAIEVLFHDSSRHASRLPLLTDYYGFDKASLGEKGVLYSSPATKGSSGVTEEGATAAEADGDVAAMVMFRPFDPWAPNSEWTAQLAVGEEALCLATGTSFVAVATSRHLLRLFSLAGSQTAVLRLDGPPVAAVARGAQLAVVWHSGPPNPHTKSQSLSMSLYDTTSLSCAFSQPLSLTPGSLLTWVGFTEDHGAPAVADSEGVVCVRTPDFGGRWVPVFEPEASRRSSEVLWPVGLTASQLFAIVCKPSEPRPQVSPRPFYTPMDLAPPMLALDRSGPSVFEGQALLLGLSNAALRVRYEAADAAGQVEEASDTNHLMMTGQAEQDRALLRALQKVLRSDRHARALELAAQLNLYKSLQGALTLANHHQARGLAERISAFMTSRQEMLEPTDPYAAAAAAAAAHRPQGRSYTPIPFGRRGEPEQQAHVAAAASGADGDADGDADGSGAAAPTAQTQPLGPADMNAGGGGGGLTPFAEMVTAAAHPGSAGLSTGPKAGRGLPTPNTLLQAATAKPDPASDSHKRKPAPTYNNPFARKAPKLGK